ncbi:DUF5723 family protein [Winogradskyella sp.]|uniref:DUF5723 family protein n=1 Tax=Winogradskyella sp. TaxID=1883156 RepID=UPI0025D061A4|nr:DUF5723 family protein [Winogradskyella sp.]
MKKQILLSSVLCLIATFTYGQSYVGHAIDNYSGVQGVAYNPSSIVGSNLKTDINLFSASFFGGSDYFGINVSDIISSDGGFDFDEDTEKFPSDENNFFLNADVLGPSFMFNLNKKSSIGLISRVRASFNINNINGELYESVADDFDTDDDFDFDSRNLNGTIHAWAEIGLAYGRILVDKPNHLLKGGATIKYLQGGGSVFMDSPGMQGQYMAATETLTTQGELNYGTSRDFEDGDIDFSDLTAGFGLDIGFTYQWHPNREKDSVPSYKDPYKLKIGVSVTDIGSINYDDATITAYNLNATVDASTFDEDTEDFLDDNYAGVETKKAAKIKLPTALHLLVDYRLAKKWFVSAQADLSMVKDGTELSNSVINTVTLAPRLETKWFSFYAPLSFRQYRDVSFGGGFRFGPLTVGSGSVFTNLLSDSSKTTDVYVGLKIPIYRK